MSYSFPHLKTESYLSDLPCKMWNEKQIRWYLKALPKLWSHTNVQNYYYTPKVKLFSKHLLSIPRQIHLNLFFHKSNNKGLKFMNQTKAVICLQMNSFTRDLWFLKADWLLRLTSQLIRLLEMTHRSDCSYRGPHFPWVTSIGNAFLNERA